MGLDQTINFDGGQLPTWSAIRSQLDQGGFPVQLRMIDDALSFPDEVPPEPWRELRLGTPQGMVTLRRNGDQLVCITWGNADAALLQAWNAVAWACAAAGGGRVGAHPAADFRRSAELPAVLRPVS